MTTKSGIERMTQPCLLQQLLNTFCKLKPGLLESYSPDINQAIFAVREWA